MVKGMDSLDVSDLAMGNGQTTATLMDNDGEHCALKQDGRKKHDVSLDILDSKVSTCTVPPPQTCTVTAKTEEANNMETCTKQEDLDGFNNETNSGQNDKIEKHFGKSITFCSDSIKELLLLHLDLMEQQQTKLQEKDKMIAQLKAEKDQLEARLTRMERRMAVQRKHAGDDASEEAGVTHRARGSTLQAKAQASISVPQPAPKRSRFSLSSVTVTSKQTKDCGLGTYIQTETTYLHSEPTNAVVDNTAEKGIVIVPNFRITMDGKTHTRSPSKRHEKTSSDDNLENLDNETFYRRHQKQELDERRRKRWDIQHTRHQRQQENLKFRQKEREVQRKSNGKKDQEEVEKVAINSLMPDPEKLIAIEVSNQVPVSAFGCRVPAIQQREFHLPWFDIAKREVQLRQMKERREKREKDRQRKRSRRRNSRRW